MTPQAAAWSRAATTAAVVLAADQLTKTAITAWLARGESVELGLGVRLVDVRNTGVAFGLLRDGGLAVVLVTMAVLGLLLLYFGLEPRRRGLWMAVGLLVGGAAGNLADRVRQGEVTDFIDPPVWPAFNVADMAIVAGIALLVAVQLRAGDRDGAGKSAGA